MSNTTFYNLDEKTSSDDIEQFFPEWESDSECIVAYSPHDDDALLGVGYLLLAARARGADCHVFIFCNGCGGYSDPEEKEKIVDIRRKETTAAYRHLGLDEDHIYRFDYPDFSVLPYIGWQLPGMVSGHLKEAITRLRELGATRLLIPNAHREHLDHEAVARMGLNDGPQAGDPILADWGCPTPVKSVFEYSVWSDFSPEEALTRGRSQRIRANRALKVGSGYEQKIREGIREYRSQAEIIQGLVERREERNCDGNYIEVYLDRDPRPRLDYGPYRRLVGEISGR